MTIPEQFLEEEFKLLEDDEHEDEDASENNENDEFELLTDHEALSSWAVIIVWSNFTLQEKLKLLNWKIEITKFIVIPYMSPLPPPPSTPRI